MKRISVIIISLAVSLAMYAQGYRAYIQVIYSPLPRAASVVVGDSAIVLKDSKGQPLKFNTAVAVLNWLSKKGWHVEPVNMNSTQGNTFLMSRENTTDKELESMFRKGKGK